MRVFVFFIAVLLSTGHFAQASEYNLPQPQGWGKETLQFPLQFAPKIKYTGTEEIRFAPGWGNKQSEQFWSYCFIWWINGKQMFETGKLQSEIFHYFDGLTSSVARQNRIAGDRVSKTKIELHKEIASSGSLFSGRVITFDAFTTQKEITLNTKIYVNHYGEKTLVFFQFSPQPFTHRIWAEMDAIKNGVIFLKH